MKTLQPIKRRIFYLIILAAGFIWIWLSAATPAEVTSGAIPAPQKGFLAPDFSLSTQGGEPVTLSELRGQPLIINFWATWCPPCRAEMPAIQNVYDEYADQGLIVLAINATTQDKVENIQGFLSEYNLTFPILLDSGAAMRAYQIRSLPSTFFIGRDGVIREVVIGGPISEALLRTRVEHLLEELP